MRGCFLSSVVKAKPEAEEKKYLLAVTLIVPKNERRLYRIGIKMVSTILIMQTREKISEGWTYMEKFFSMVHFCLLFR